MVLVFAVAASACVAPSRPAAQESPTGPTASPQPTAVDPRLLTLTVGISLEGQTWDPHVNTGGNGGNRYFPSVYESLVSYAADGSFRPSLAQSWTVTDGRSYRFKLRSGVKFSDGTTFNAQAVADAFARLRKIGVGTASFFTAIKAINPIDDLTVDLVLSEPYAPLLALLADWPAAIFVSPTAAKANAKDGDDGKAWLHEHTAGTGPFMLESWEPGGRLVLVRNPHYWGSVAPDSIQRVVMTVVKEPATMRQMLEAGDIDIAEDISPAFIERMRQAPGVKVNIDPIPSTNTVLFNLKKKPFDDPNVRKAIAYAIDYQRLVTVWEGTAQQAQGPFQESMKPWFSARDAVKYQKDLAKAGEFLRKSGYTVPISPAWKVKLIWRTALPTERDMATLIAEDLAKIGIQVEIIGQDATVWREAVWTNSFELAFIQQTLRFQDPDAFASQYVISTEFRYRGQNPGIVSPQLDKLIVAARGETNVDARKEQYNEFQRAITEDALFLFLTTRARPWAQGVNVAGLQWIPNAGYHDGYSNVRKTGVRAR